jgi:ABC-type lipoprotein export system ATPase subunit
MTETREKKPEVLRLEGVSMRFGAVTAIESVDLQIRQGEVVALLGDNGAGKSTLIKIISGSLQPTGGRYFFDGVERRFSSPHDAKVLGIETVYQDLSICMNVDVVANFFMGREMVRRVLGIPILREAEMRTITEDVLKKAGTRIPSVRIDAEHLSGGQRQAIELNRFVHWGRQTRGAGRTVRCAWHRAGSPKPRNDRLRAGERHRRAHRHPQYVARFSNRRSGRGDAPRSHRWRFGDGRDNPRRSGADNHGRRDAPSCSMSLANIQAEGEGKCSSEWSYAQR